MQALRGWLPLLLLASVLAILPWLLPNAFYFDVAIRMLINACVVLGLNLLMGYTGQISLGHAGFFGLGAYGSAILCGHFNWPPLPALLVTAMAVGVVAWLLAIPILKLKGHYLAMATLGLGVIITIVLVNELAWTGGPDGMAVVPFAVAGVELNGDRSWYALMVAVLLLITLTTTNLIHSPAGRALQAIHGSEIAARVSGINVGRFKARVFAYSAIIASAMGSLTAHYVAFVTPGMAGLLHSIELVTMVVVGGMASVYGAIIGAALLTGLPQLLAAFEGWETVIYGAILVMTMIFLPRGLVPSLWRWRHRKRR